MQTSYCQHFFVPKGYPPASLSTFSSESGNLLEPIICISDRPATQQTTATLPPVSIHLHTRAAGASGATSSSLCRSWIRTSILMTTKQELLTFEPSSPPPCRSCVQTEAIVVYKTITQQALHKDPLWCLWWRPESSELKNVVECLA